MRQEDNRQPMGSESLGTLVSSWRDGTFSEIWADWKWIWGYTKRYRRAVWFYTILGVASSTLGLVSAVASKYSIDIITGYDSDHLWFIVTVMVASALVGLLLRSVTSRISTKISLRVNNDIQAQVFDRLLGADWRSLNAFASGDLLSRLSTDVGSVSSSAIRWLPDLIVTAYTFAATLAVILHYDWVMALLALASAPFLLLTSRRLIRGMRTHQQEVRQVGSRLMSYETETLHNLDAIKGFGITGRYGRGFRSRQEEFRRASLDYNLFSIRTEILLSLLGSAVQMAAFGYCLYLLWSGKILYGTMTLFLSQGAKLSSAFNALVRTVPSFLSASVSARRIRDLYALEPEPVLPDDGLDSLASQGFTVAVEDASYAYVPHQPVLTHADFRAAPGETVALVGPSGGGKTTMIRLLLGLIRPAEGRAYLQAADGRQVEVNAGLRRYFSYVPQGNTLLSGTIADNLRMVKPDASDAQLRAALEAACAWDFVSAMDGGLDASVGEHGHGLSEGQAQRIAIARALLRDAPVLLLDEATSALDVATERTILRNLAARYPHKTCIVTTHRPTVISLCRRVYQVSSGCLRLLDSDEAQRLAMDF
ncbi:MAG: ABC transporter ATP-binding protein [Oscillospiraceae bacterium]|jgi:ABC-type multidrug transport system fused ATPase/permease subunit|nr:ABC transporter ATP-binding protein [Oscillospiraceae bacterium]